MIIAAAGIGFAINSGTHSSAPKLSKDDLARAVDQPQFCRDYARELAAGYSDDVAYGQFLQGYQRARQATAGGIPLPPAHDVFDELKGRC